MNEYYSLNKYVFKVSFVAKNTKLGVHSVKWLLVVIFVPETAKNITAICKNLQEQNFCVKLYFDT